MSHYYFTCSLLTIASVLVPAMARAQSVPDPAGTTQVEDIVVTAQRREERLQDVPISITALGERQITEARIQNITDLASIAPNLTVTQRGLAAATFVMRGIVATGALPGQDKGVSVYLDGVYLSANTGGVFDAADIERIEVLKGPQGTLFGRNSTAGAISIISQLPTGELGWHQEIGYGNQDQIRSKTRVNLPTWGPLSLAATYFHSERRGDIRNLGGGTQWDYRAATGGAIGILTSPDYLNGENNDAVFVAARLEADDLDVVYRYDNSHRVAAEGQGVYGFGEPGFVPGFVTVALNSQPAANAGNLTPISTKRPDAVNNAFTTPGRFTAQGHNLTLSYQLSDAVQFKNIAAWRKTTARSTSEFTGTGGLVVTPEMVAYPFLGAPLAAFVGQPFLFTGIIQQFRQRQLSNESQFNVDLERFKLTVGALIFDDKTKSGPFPGAGTAIAFGAVPNFVIRPTPGVPLDDRRFTDLRGKSTAVYAQGEFEPVSGLSLVGGLRQTWDRKSGVDRSIPPIEAPFDLKSNRLTWLAGVNYKPNEEVLLFTKASTGFISGGVYGGFQYAPESVRSYEAGVKADLFDRRLRTNLAMFYADYKDLQFLTRVNNVSRVQNAGDARAWGFEFEGTVIPVRGLTLNAGVGYTNFRYKRIDPVVFTGDISNYRPILRPDWTATLSSQYETPELGWGGTVRFRLEGQYRSEQFGDPVLVRPENLAASTFPSHWKFDARVAVTKLKIDSATAELAFWGKNIFNNRDLATSTYLSYIQSGYYEQARRYGVDLTFDF